MKVLHIIPNSVVDPHQKYLGSTKDIRGRTEYFEARGFDYEELVVSRSDVELRNILVKKDLSLFHAIFIELPIYPASLHYIREKQPGLRIFVRSINAEFYHDWHHMIAGLKHKFWKNAMLYSVFAWRRLYWDFICANRSDVCFSITDWETANYWRYLVPDDRRATLPYFLPSKYSSNIKDVPKSNNCVCLLSTVSNAFLVDAAKNFSTAVSRLEDKLPDWNFFLIGAEELMPLVPIQRLNALGLLESPFEILARSKVVAILSDYGFGFKTKILDAILHKCFVLLTPGLFNRLPDILKPFCVSVDINDPGAFETAIINCMRPFPEHNPNELLQSDAFSALDAAFNLPRDRI